MRVERVGGMLTDCTNKEGGAQPDISTQLTEAGYGNTTRLPYPRAPLCGLFSVQPKAQAIGGKRSLLP